MVTLEGMEIEVVSDVYARTSRGRPDGSELDRQPPARSVAAPRRHQPVLDQHRRCPVSRRPAGSRVSWSPTGSWIVSQRGKAERKWLWVTGVDGSGESLLAEGFGPLTASGRVVANRGVDRVSAGLRSASTFPEEPCREESDVVLIPAGGGFDGRGRCRRGRHPAPTIAGRLGRGVPVSRDLVAERHGAAVHGMGTRSRWTVAHRRPARFELAARVALQGGTENDISDLRRRRARPDAGLGEPNGRIGPRLD